MVERYWRQGKTEVLRETPVRFPVLSAANLTMTGVGSNPGIRGETSATDHLSRGTVLKGENLPGLYNVSARTAQ